MPGMKKTMAEFKAGELHSGSKHGPEVKSRSQAIAIGLSEERKAGAHIPKPKKGHAMKKKEYGHGHPGEHLHLKEEGPARLGAGVASGSGPVVAPSGSFATGTKSHGFGHAAHLRHGSLRMSGHSGAHRIGARKK